MDYKYEQRSGALQEAMGTAPVRARKAASVASLSAVQTQLAPPPLEAVVQSALTQAGGLGGAAGAELAMRRAAPLRDGLDRGGARSGGGMFFYTVEDGARVLMVSRDGTMRILEGPTKVSRWFRRFRPMQHYVAHPGEFLIVRCRDGRQEHLAGPTHVWLDPRTHSSIEKEDALQISGKEAVVVYARAEDGTISRRVVHGPATFVPAPGEWLHTFSWHGTAGDGTYRKVPNALRFQKLWRMPDQMYHDVEDVRTADDAQITVRLMVFFELVDVERMLETSHDPIGDFVNAATSDVVEFTGRHDFEGFKQHTDRLNELATYRQLVSRAEQCGYRVHKVVYRGYGAPESLQQMQDQAIESRTRLQLEKATERQAQELEDLKLDRSLARTQKQRLDEVSRVEQQLALEDRGRAAQRAADKARLELEREQRSQDAALEARLEAERQARQAAHLEALRALGVDLTAYLTHDRPDRVVEVRGGAPHLHLDAGR
jgi:hypothetical protein